LKEGMSLQRSLGLDTQYLTCKDVRRIAPVVSVDEVLGATYCSTDGYANPFKTVDAFAIGARRWCANIRPYTEAIGILVRRDQIRGVRTATGVIATNIVINAAGAWSKAIARMANVDLPLLPFRHQLLVTEPVRHVMDPLVISMYGGGRQTAHGEFLLNCQQRNDVEGIDFSSSLEYLKNNATTILKIFPGLGSLRILRQWAGHYTMTPDANPIVGETDEVKGFIQANGYSGHGFMIAPRIAELIADMIVKGEKPQILEEYDPKRFRAQSVMSIESNVFGLDRSSR
jgi:sarcosine oxidase subunit beta